MESWTVILLGGYYGCYICEGKKRMPGKKNYDIKDFIECCSKHPEQVVILEKALKDA